MLVVLAVVLELNRAASGVDLVNGELGAVLGGGAVERGGAGQRADVAELELTTLGAALGGAVLATATGESGYA